MSRFPWRFTFVVTVLSLAGIAYGITQDQPPPRRARPERNGNIIRLGKTIFFDQNISNPTGMSCASCHAPETGFGNPNSYINNADGTVPGAIASRFGNRKPMTISYSWFAPDGPTFFRRRQQRWEAGFFADGRADTLEDQAGMPMVNPNEMNNLVHGLPSPELVVQKISRGSYTDQFREAFGNDALAKPSTDVFLMIRKALTAYEQSREVSPFSSKYDAVLAGEAKFTTSELNGLRLFTGSTTGRPGGAANYKNAQCTACHRMSPDADRHDFFTDWSFANDGVPRNPHNPYYKQNHPVSNPQGSNAEGDHYIDLGLGSVLYPRQNLPAGNIGPGNDGRGDFLRANGEFRIASLRNVDKRPSAGFVKCYMHNGVFKSLKDVVHFYNTRNLTTSRGEVIDFTQPNPYANLKGKPLWPQPEYDSAVTLQNPTGRPNSRANPVGNLGLTEQEEADIVAFLGTLSDGYFTPARRPPPPPN